MKAQTNRREEGEKKKIPLQGVPILPLTFLIVLPSYRDVPRTCDVSLLSPTTSHPRRQVPHARASTQNLFFLWDSKPSAGHLFDILLFTANLFLRIHCELEDSTTQRRRIYVSRQKHSMFWPCVHVKGSSKETSLEADTLGMRMRYFN